MAPDGAGTPSDQRPAAASLSTCASFMRRRLRAAAVVAQSGSRETAGGMCRGARRRLRRAAPQPASNCGGAERARRVGVRQFHYLTFSTVLTISPISPISRSNVAGGGGQRRLRHGAAGSTSGAMAHGAGGSRRSLRATTTPPPPPPPTPPPPRCVKGSTARREEQQRRSTLHDHTTVFALQLETELGAPERSGAPLFTAGVA